jgi:hypothetical protein
VTVTTLTQNNPTPPHPTSYPQYLDRREELEREYEEILMEALREENRGEEGGATAGDGGSKQRR